ncbi:MAG: Uma2 family endonuclease [Acidobacteria bacterium]|nr:Uma2 family endonuclease [Acidobacteriota bacterium]
MSKELINEIELDVSHLVTEDDEPVDNLPSEKHQRLLTSSLYSGWTGPGEDCKFLAAANVGIFNAIKQSPVVPDMFISLDVEIADNWWKKEHRSYFTWEFGKPPDLVIEIVSNKEGKENTNKLGRYAWMRVLIYIIYDPMKHIMDNVLTVYRLNGNAYQLYSYETEDLLPNLRVTLWQGEFENKDDVWLRWTDSKGNLILTGDELAEQQRQEKEQERQAKERERQEKEQERQAKEQERQAKEIALEQAKQERQAKEDALVRAERLAAKLKELGIDPESL